MTHLRDPLAVRDPGWLNLEFGLRAALSCLAAWYGMQLLFAVTPASPRAGAMVYAVMATFYCSFFIAERRVSPRKHITLMSVFPVMAAAVIPVLIGQRTVLGLVILLALIFASFAVRPRSQAFGTLLLIAVMCWDITVNAHVTVQTLGWYLAASAIGVAMTYAGQFLVLPGNEQAALRRVCSAMLAAGRQIGHDIQATPTSGASSQLAYQQRLVDAAQQAISDRLIQVEQVGVADRRLATDLRLAANAFVRGTHLMVKGVSDLAGIDAALPAPIQDRLNSALEIWNTRLDNDGPARHEDEARVSWDRVRELAREYPDAPWRKAVLELVVGGTGSATAATNLFDIEREIAKRAVGTAAQGQNAFPEPPPSPITALATPQVIMRSPAVTIGIQATVATAVAMVVAWLLGVNHPDWTFFGAFSVVATSAGESIRRIGFRITGTIVGCLVGILVATTLHPAGPTAAWLLAMCVLVAIFARPWSYTTMIAALTVAIAIAWVGVGGSGSRLLVDRSVGTVLGAAIGGLVAITVFPIRLERHFSRQVADFLQAIDAWLGSTLDWMNHQAPFAQTRERTLEVQRTAGALVATLPAVASEFNPMTHTRSEISRYGVKLLTVDRAIEHLATWSDVYASEGDPGETRVLPQVQEVLVRSRSVISTVVASLDEKDPPEPGSLPEPGTRPDLSSDKRMSDSAQQFLRSALELLNGLSDFATSVTMSNPARTIAQQDKVGARDPPP